MRVSLALFALTCLFGYSTSQDDGQVQISFFPEKVNNVHKKGDYIKMFCKAKKSLLDLLQVMKEVDGTMYEISTNNNLRDVFKNTNRYALLSTTDDDGFQEVQISIDDLQGEDSGRYECWHTLLDQSKSIAAEAMTVLVPPKSVELMQYDSGDVNPVPNTGKLVLREGEDHGIICQVKVAGSDDQPTVDITLDGQSMVSMFQKTEDKTTDGVNELPQRDITVVYEYLTPNPSTDFHGKQLTCSAATEGFDAISSTVDLVVHYAPRLQCNTTQGVLGKPAKLTCFGNMYPEVELASFSWTRQPDRFSLDLDNKDTDRHHFELTKDSDTKYRFEVTIDEVQENDFGRYLLEVQNAHSPQEHALELVKGALPNTPAPTPAPTDPPYKVTGDQGAPKPPEPSTGLAHRPISSIFTVVLAFLMCLSHL